MMNYGVFGLCHLLKELAIMEERLMTRVRALNDINASGYAKELREIINPGVGKWDQVNEVDLQQVRGWLRFATQQADTMELQPVHDRIEIFERKLRFQPMSLQDLFAEVRTLRETLESGIRFKRFYLYPEGKAQLYVRFEADWRAVIDGFPRTKDDAKAAVDCYALGHSTASVFYSMRVVEHGLRTFAGAVNVTFDVQQWNAVIEEIEASIKNIAKAWPASITKSAWLSFYSSAAKEFFYFKDGWRNYVSHGGDPYDDQQAHSVLEHVKAFMSHLAPCLGDKTALVAQP